MTVLAKSRGNHNIRYPLYPPNSSFWSLTSRRENASRYEYQVQARARVIALRSGAAKYRMVYKCLWVEHVDHSDDSSIFETTFNFCRCAPAFFYLYLICRKCISTLYTQNRLHQSALWMTNPLDLEYSSRCDALVHSKALSKIMNEAMSGFKNMKQTNLYKQHQV